MRLASLGGAAQERPRDVDDQVCPVEGIRVRADVQFRAGHQPVKVDVCHACEANGT